MNTDPGQPAESPLQSAHRRAVALAVQCADPILQPELFDRIYWTTMGGFGYVIHVPGRSRF
jgi:hypothetical protein